MIPGQRHEPSRNPVVTVGAYNTNTKLLGHADYPCDGTADNAQIQAAINALGTAGGTVRLMQGSYNLAASGRLALNGDDSAYLTITGDGMGATNIAYDSPASYQSIFRLYGAAGDTLNNITIKDMSLSVTTASSATAMIDLQAASGTAVFNNITIKRVGFSSAVAVTGIFSNYLGTYNNLKIEDCIIDLESGSGNYGIIIFSGNGIWILRNLIDLNNAAAYNAISLYGDCTNFHVLHNRVTKSGHSCIACSAASNGEIIGNDVTIPNAAGDGAEGEAGIEVEYKSTHQNTYTSHNIVVAGNLVHGTAGDTAGKGILINDRSHSGSYDPYNIAVKHNIVRDAALVGIHVYEALNTIVKDNIITGCTTAVTNANNAAVIENNVGCESHGVLNATYDFAVHGGAISTIGLGTMLPDNAIVTRAWYEVITTLTSGGGTDNAVVGISIPTDDADGILTGVAIKTGTPWDEGLHECIQDGTAANFSTKTTAQRELSLTITTEAVTAGKAVIYCEYVVTA